jgi:DNA-binding transcriptional MerR regulator
VPSLGSRSARLTVGVLAKRTGLSVRTLHHYDAIGLLTPSARTESRYRLYGARDLRRLQKIVMMRGLGLPLAEIARALAGDGVSALAALELQLSRLRERIAHERRLCTRLESLAAALRRGSLQTLDDVIESIQEMTMFEKYFTPDQMDQIQARGRTIGSERIREVEAEWPMLIADMRREMEAGTPPSSTRVQALAARWGMLVREFTDGRPEIAAGLRQMYQKEDSVRQRTNIDATLMKYVGRAMAASHEGRR